MWSHALYFVAKELMAISMASISACSASSFFSSSACRASASARRAARARLIRSMSYDVRRSHPVSAPWELSALPPSVTATAIPRGDGPTIPANFFCENAPAPIDDQHHHARIDCGRSNVGERQDCDQEPCERELVYPLAHLAFATGSPSDEPYQARRSIIQDEGTVPARL